MNTNMRSIYHLTMLCVPHLIASKGTIVNVSSVNGIRSFPGVLAYNLSKAAVDQFTRCVALELVRFKISVLKWKIHELRFFPGTKAGQ